VQDFLAAVNAAATTWPPAADASDPGLTQRVQALATTYLGTLPDGTAGS
jgi:hypothetical protein